MPTKEPFEHRLTLEDCPAAIDIRAWRREGKLTPGTSFRAAWGNPRAPSAMLAVAVRENGFVVLLKRLNPPFDKLPIAEETVAAEVALTPVAPIIYFICPGCGGHALKLHVHPTEVVFRCASCVGLPPKSNLRSKKERRSQRLERINDLLGVPAWVPSAQVPKPASMQWVRFEGLRAERNRLQAAGVRESQSVFESVEAERRRRELEEQIKYRNMRNGVLYFD
jgi:hypothetical protein